MFLKFENFPLSIKFALSIKFSLYKIFPSIKLFLWQRQDNWEQQPLGYLVLLGRGGYLKQDATENFEMVLWIFIWEKTEDAAFSPFPHVSTLYLVKLAPFSHMFQPSQVPQLPWMPLPVASGLENLTSFNPIPRNVGKVAVENGRDKRVTEKP